MNPLYGAVLAGGSGTRLRPLTLHRPKPLLPVAGQTLLEHNLAKLAAVGAKSVAIVIPARDKAIPQALGRGWRGMHLSYVEQRQPKGTGHALNLLREYLPGAFALCFADNVTPWELSALVSLHRERKAVATLALFHAKDPRKHGIAEVKGARIVRLIEKPSEPPTDLASAGMFVFEPIIFEALAGLSEGAGGETHIADAVQVLIDSGEKVTYSVLDTWRRNVNTGEDILESNRLLLANTAKAMKQPWARNPVSIGGGCMIERDATVGPYVSMGRECRVGRLAVVQDSILLDGVSVGERCVVSGCMLGEGSQVTDGVVLRNVILADRRVAQRNRAGALRST